MFLGQQLLQHAIAVAQLWTQLAASYRRRHDRVRQVLLGRLDRPAADPAPGPPTGFASHHDGSAAHGQGEGHPHPHGHGLPQALVEDQAGAVLHPQGREGEWGVVAAPQAQAHAHGAHDGHGHGGGRGRVRFPLYAFFLKEKTVAGVIRFITSKRNLKELQTTKLKEQQNGGRDNRKE